MRQADATGNGLLGAANGPAGLAQGVMGRASQRRAPRFKLHAATCQPGLASALKLRARPVPSLKMHRPGGVRGGSVKGAPQREKRGACVDLPVGARTASWAGGYLRQGWKQGSGEFVLGSADQATRAGVCALLAVCPAQFLMLCIVEAVCVCANSSAKNRHMTRACCHAGFSEFASWAMIEGLCAAWHCIALQWGTHTLLRRPCRHRCHCTELSVGNLAPGGLPAPAYPPRGDTLPAGLPKPGRSGVI
jgi:hypothetical protein